MKNWLKIINTIVLLSIIILGVWLYQRLRTLELTIKEQNDKRSTASLANENDFEALSARLMMVENRRTQSADLSEIYRRLTELEAITYEEQ